jgi:hypothetical protein
MIEKDIEKMKIDLKEWADYLREIIVIAQEIRNETVYMYPENTKVPQKCHEIDIKARIMYSRMNEIYKELV